MAKQPSPRFISRQEVSQIMKETCAEICGVDVSDLHDHIRYYEDLLFSLEAVELQVELEEIFGIEIPDRHAQHLCTIGLTTDYIHQVLTDPTRVPEFAEPKLSPLTRRLYR